MHCPFPCPDCGWRYHFEWTWYRYPHQRALKVCYQSGWQDIFADGVPVYMLCYDNPPIWTQNKGFSMGML